MPKWRIPLAVRGLVGFALAAGAAEGIFALSIWLDPEGTRSGMMLFFVAALFVCGAAAGAILTAPRAAAASAGFGLMFVISFMGSSFVMISIQGGGSPEYLYGCVGFAVAFGFGGGVGALFLGVRAAFYGAVSFAIAGALTGPVAFWLAVHGGPLALVGLILAYAVGGALFGLALDLGAAG